MKPAPAAYRAPTKKKEKAVVAKVKHSDQENDLSRVYQQVHGRLHAFLRQRVDERWVDDILQDIFEKAIKAERNGKPVKNLPAWLFTVSRNSVADHYRKKSLPLTELDENLALASADEASFEQALEDCLEPLTRTLPHKYSATLLATDFEGRSMKSVAEESGLTVSAIKSRASRARGMLKQKLLACCGLGAAEGELSCATQCGISCQSDQGVRLLDP